ncbi:MAG: DNA primase, partial [Bacteroidales bacterium]|nr:DNA primase [Bacteroidales bacterium]
ILYENEEGKSVGLSYLKERGFTDSTIDVFQLGYAPQPRDSLLNYALKKGYTLDNLEKSGLIIVKQKEGSILRYDRFSERVIFPIHNFSGKVVGFGGRILTSKDKNHAKYINSPESAIYHKSDILYGIFQAKNAIKKADKCYLVEGYTDVISLHQAGIENVVASSGTSLTQGQIKQLTKLTNNITILYDGDSAGIDAAVRAVGMLLKENLNIRIIILPPTEDPDSFARNNDRQQIVDFFSDNEKDFIQFKINLLSKEAGKDPIKKAEFINQIAADIASIPDIIKVSLFVKQCSSLLGISEPILFRTINKIRIKNYKEGSNEKVNESQEVNTNSTINKPLRPIYAELIPLNLSDVEKEILFLLVNYGSALIYVPTENKQSEEKALPMRVDQFIFNNLDSDTIQLETPLYQQFINIYADIAEKYPNEIVNQLKNHPDKNIFSLYLNLVDIKPLPSPLWESPQIKSFINTIDNNKAKLHEYIVRCLHVLRLIKLRAIREKHEQELNNTSEIEDISMIMKKLVDVIKVINEIEKALGVTYR